MASVNDEEAKGDGRVQDIIVKIMMHSVGLGKDVDTTT